jgi:NitT/TauT family transport system permease protein
MVDGSLLVSFIVDASYSWARMFIALFISIGISVVFGVWAATSSRAEKIILPITDVLQTVPILAFFPLALVVFVYYLPPLIGIDAAVIFLIITSMVWNIIFGVYESIKTIPHEFTEVADMYRMNAITRLRTIYIPAALPRIVQQSILSWSIGLFYLVTSEIFSYGNPNCCHVIHGIGYDIVLQAPGSATAVPGGYLLALGVFVAFVIATRFLFFKPLEDYASRYLKTNVQPKTQGNPVISWFHRRIPTQPITQPITTNLRARVQGVREFVQPKKPKATRAGKRWKKRSYRLPLYASAALLMLGIAYYAIVVNPSIASYEYSSIVSLGFSFVRVWLAFALITLIAVPLCIYLVFFTKQSSRYLLLFQIIASIPATILLPAIVATFQSYPHSGEIVAFVIFFLSGIWYVIFSIIASTRSIPPNIIEVKNVYGVKGIDAWKKVYLRAIIPGFITGALTAIAAEWNASIVAENFTTAGITGSTNSTIVTSVGIGMGKLLDSTASTGNLTLLIIALINLVVMILLINTFVWKRFYKQVSKIYG